MYIFFKAAPSAKLRTLHSRLFADLYYLLDLRTQSFVICGLHTSANPHIHTFFLTNIADKAVVNIIT